VWINRTRWTSKLFQNYVAVGCSIIILWSIPKRGPCWNCYLIQLVLSRKCICLWPPSERRFGHLPIFANWACIFFFLKVKRTEWIVLLVPHMQAVKWRLQWFICELVATDAERTLECFTDYLIWTYLRFYEYFYFVRNSVKSNQHPRKRVQNAKRNSKTL
jgi:hypothetical protein